MNRRSFLGTGSLLLAGSAGIPAALAAAPLGRRLGVTAWSYRIRWGQRRKPEAPQPAWRDALDLLEHCAGLGAGCLQVGVRDWTADFAGRVRDRREQLGIALEGQIALPRDDAGLEQFTSQIAAAREAGATVVRTVCLGGRRYESFSSMEEWRRFVKESRTALERVEPIVSRHGIKLAVENHKDWRIDEFLSLLEHLSSDSIGVTFDFGNNFALLEHPHAVGEALAPFVMTTHVKDMGLAPHEDGFLLSEVPLGEGVLDLERMMTLCSEANPDVQFNLEMITRDPLRVPVWDDSYWNTMPDLPAHDLARTVRLAQAGDPDSLPSMKGRDAAGEIAFEEENVRRSFAFARERLGFS